MRYTGGKARIGKQIAAKILEIVPPEHRLEYLEPFLGGANSFEYIAPHFQTTYTGDIHTDLILMWQAVARGWVPPEHVTVADYETLKRQDASSALRGFVGFSCGFSGGWFRGNAPDDIATYAERGRRVVGRQASIVRRATTLEQVSYLDWPVVPGVVLYCDPPYAGTVDYKGAKGFDHVRFWQRMREWSEAGSYVFVSEYTAPEDWPCIWSIDRHASIAAVHGQSLKTYQDRLFFKGPQRWADDVSKAA